MFYQLKQNKTISARITWSVQSLQSSQASQWDLVLHPTILFWAKTPVSWLFGRKSKSDRLTNSTNYLFAQSSAT